ncbi:heat shock protein Hsp20 [Bacillus methanolicus PB1]|uniref:Heat shock protein Hsp20 n=1 Tax=Bacillus methanolicus PB1 TaxID=997296 RepID=I3DWL6_BACMT|nr:Hsp20/alpha crystallin family protein [Bacillus methanolicus]EIJ78637.1 heat shock protein Hsp20 [Bacillus methanolicus PB1]
MSSNLPSDPKRNRQEPFGEIIKSMNDFFNEKPVKGFLQSIDEFFKSPFPLSSFPVDVTETDREHIVTAELPGVKKEQIDINVLGNFLTISVNRDETITEQNETAKSYRKRQSFQRTSRTIGFDQPVNEKNVKASYKNGLLEIRVPKLKGKQIIIDAE